MLVLLAGIVLVNGTIVPTITVTDTIGASAGALVNRGSKKYEKTKAEARQDYEDNIADASATSYRTVIIHNKPDNGKKDIDGNSNVRATESEVASSDTRSESYFKFYSPGFKNNFRHTQGKKSTIIRTTEAPKMRNELQPNIRYVENFRADEARVPHSLISQFHYNPTEPPKEESRFISTQTNSDNADFKSYFRTEENFKTSTLNRLKNHRNEDSSRNHPTFESSLIPSATALRLEIPTPKEFNYALNPFNKLQPPPGMSEELMETLLQQEPQTFQDVELIKRYESKKKPANIKGRDGASSFNVGYSIGFGKLPKVNDDVVFGRPKDVKVHVNGEKSVWKQLQGGVEMSQDLESGKLVQIKLPDSVTISAEPEVSVTNKGAQPVFYMNNHSPDIDNVPTAGKTYFDHHHALTSSNVFDFSNAMASPPIALPLQSPLPVIPENQHIPFSLKPAGRGYDMSSFYQSIGYNAPVPVYIPGYHGNSHMVQAIVIPLENLNNVQMNWGNLVNTFADEQITTPSAIHEPVAHEKPPKRLIKFQRKPKDSTKSSSSFSTTSSVLGPHKSLTHRPYNLQIEQASLNAILAQEMSRKNKRHPPIGLRPPPAKYS